MGNKASLMLQDEEIRQISEETGFSAQQIEKLYSRFTHLDRTNCGALSKNDLLSIPELAINPLCDRLIEMFFGGTGDSRHPPDDEEERINFKQFMRVLAAFRTSGHVQPAIADVQVTPKPGSNSNSRRLGQLKSVSADLVASSNGDQPPPPLGGNRTSGTHRHRNSSVTRPHNTRSQDSNNNLGVVESLSDCLRDKLYFLFKIYDADNDGRICFNDLKSILKMMVGNYIEDVQLDKIATRAFVEVDRDNDGFVEFGEFCRVFAGKDMDDKLRVRFF